MYDLLFGDAPLHAWPSNDSREDRPGEPWGAFIAARAAWHAGDKAGAVARWQAITRMNDIESRHIAQAWTFLREAAAGPAEASPEAHELLGVIIEMTVNAGLDVLAAYPDHHAMYLNHAGAAVMWMRPNDALDGLIDDVLECGRFIVDQTGVWEQPRLEPAVGGLARVNMLTPAGLHFGQGPAEMFFKDQRAAPLLNAGTMLMKAMMEMERTAATSG